MNADENENPYQPSGVPPAPPGTSRSAVELWRRVLAHRIRQASSLSPSRFRGFRDAVVAQGAHTFPPGGADTVGDLACRLISLFYRSVDERLADGERRRALGAIKAVFLNLDKFLALDAASQDPALRVADSPSRDVSVQGSSRSETETRQDHQTNDENEEGGEPESVRSETASARGAANDPPHHPGDTPPKRKGIDEGDRAKGAGGGSSGKRRREDVAAPSGDAASAEGGETPPEQQRAGDEDGQKEGEGREPNVTGEGGEQETTAAGDEAASSPAPAASVAPAGLARPSSVARPAPPLPAPQPFSLPCCVAFLADDDRGPAGLAGGGLHPRAALKVSHDAGYCPYGTGSCLDDAAATEVRARLETWDPYWKVVHELGRRAVPAAGGTITRAAVRTTACTPVGATRSCAILTVYPPSAAERRGVRLGEAVAAPRTGDRRLLLRMLPLRPDGGKGGSRDVHQWPIGTFLQLSRGATQRALHLRQRRQQSHDPALWKGLCHPLDLSAALPDASNPFTIEICAREAIEEAAAPPPYELGTRVSKLFEDEGCMRPFAGTVRHCDEVHKLYRIVYEDDDSEELTHQEVTAILVDGDHDARLEERKLLRGSYAIHLAICEYVEPNDLYDKMVQNIPTVSLESAKSMARKYSQRQTVSLDSDAEGGEEGDKEGSSTSGGSTLTFSLLCPITRTVIDTPVRGRHCRHMQCFDLRNWLHANRHVSGGRWRCGSCESFVPARDLVVCGLFRAMLRDHGGEVSGALRDGVSYRPDGSWCLKAAGKARRTDKQDGGGAGGGDKSALEDSFATKEAKDASMEIIDLL